MNNKRTGATGLAIAALLTTQMLLADEIVVTETRDSSVAVTAADARVRLEKNHAAAAKKAVEAVLADTKLDLDIRLIGPTSVKVAADR